MTEHDYPACGVFRGGKCTCVFQDPPDSAVGRVDGDGNVEWFDPIPEEGAYLYAAPKENKNHD